MPVTSIDVQDLTAAFDLATSAPYAFAERVLKHPDEVYMLRFGFTGSGAERNRDLMQYFL